MKKEIKSAASILRQKAEELLKMKLSVEVLKNTEDEVLKLIHELAVYQVGLESQNEDLILTKKC
jgi:hypothetical protein